MSDFVENFVSTWKNVVLSPENFFKNMPTQGGYEEPLKFAVVNLLIYGVIAGISALLLAGLMIPFAPAAPAFAGAAALLYIIGIPVLGIIGLFIGGVILLVCFKIMGGTGSYEGTVRILSYVSALDAIAWIPLVNILAFLYGIYLTIVGGKYVHNLTMGKSAIAVLIPIIVLIIIAIILAAIIAAFIYGMSGGGF